MSSMYKTRLCNLFQYGTCNRPNCTFAHGEEELRRPGPFSGGRSFGHRGDPRDRNRSPPLEYHDRRRRSPVPARKRGRSRSPNRSFEDYSDQSYGSRQPSPSYSSEERAREKSRVRRSVKVSADDSARVEASPGPSLTELEEEKRSLLKDVSVKNEHLNTLETLLDRKKELAEELATHAALLEKEISEKEGSVNKVSSQLKKLLKAQQRVNATQDDVKRLQSKLQKVVAEVTPEDIAVFTVDLPPKEVGRDVLSPDPGLISTAQPGVGRLHSKASNPPPLQHGEDNPHSPIIGAGSSQLQVSNVHRDLNPVVVEGKNTDVSPVDVDVGTSKRDGGFRKSDKSAILPRSGHASPSADGTTVRLAAKETPGNMKSDSLHLSGEQRRGLSGLDPPHSGPGGKIRSLEPRAAVSSEFSGGAGTERGVALEPKNMPEQFLVPRKRGLDAGVKRQAPEQIRTSPPGQISAFKERSATAEEETASDEAPRVSMKFSRESNGKKSVKSEGPNVASTERSVQQQPAPQAKEGGEAVAEDKDFLKKKGTAFQGSRFDVKLRADKRPIFPINETVRTGSVKPQAISQLQKQQQQVQLELKQTQEAKAKLEAERAEELRNILQGDDDVDKAKSDLRNVGKDSVELPAKTEVPLTSDKKGDDVAGLNQPLGPSVLHEKVGEGAAKELEYQYHFKLEDRMQSSQQQHFSSTGYPETAAAYSNAYGSALGVDQSYLQAYGDAYLHDTAYGHPESQAVYGDVSAAHGAAAAEDIEDAEPNPPGLDEDGAEEEATTGGAEFVCGAALHYNSEFYNSCCPASEIADALPDFHPLSIEL